MALYLKMIEYALQKSGEVLATGTLEEISKSQGLKISTLKFYMTASYIRRYEKSKNRISLVAISEELTKVCKICNNEKKVSAFHKASRTKDGRQSMCKPCRAKLDASRRASRKSTNNHSADKEKWHSILKVLA